MNTRRKFLLGGMGIIAVAGIGGLTFGRMGAESEIAALVRRRLSFLRLNDAGVRAFAKDQVAALLAKRPSWNRWKYHFLAMFTKSFTQYGSSNDHRTRIQRIEDNLATTYLLSSDFFINGADESRTVEYLGLYDPLRPCGNPFARPAVSSQVTS